MFLAQLFFTVSLVLWRGELISEAGVYDEVSQQSRHGSGSSGGQRGHYDLPKGGGQFAQQAPSADL
jgi:hypothetical protein